MVALVVKSVAIHVSMKYKTMTRRELTVVGTACRNSVQVTVRTVLSTSLLKQIGSLALKARVNVATHVEIVQRARMANGMVTRQARIVGVCIVNVLTVHVAMASETNLRNRSTVVAQIAHRALLAKTESGMVSRMEQIVAAATFMDFLTAHSQMSHGGHVLPVHAMTVKSISARKIGSMAPKWVASVVGQCVLRVRPATTGNGTVTRTELIVVENTATAHYAVARMVNLTKEKQTGSPVLHMSMNAAAPFVLSARRAMMAYGMVTKPAQTAQHLEEMVLHGTIIEVVKFVCVTTQK